MSDETRALDQVDSLPKTVGIGHLEIGPFQRLVEVKIPGKINDGVWLEIFDSMFGHFDMDTQCYSIRMNDIVWDDQIPTLFWAILDAARRDHVDILVLIR